MGWSNDEQDLEDHVTEAHSNLRIIVGQVPSRGARAYRNVPHDSTNEKVSFLLPGVDHRTPTEAPPKEFAALLNHNYGTSGPAKVSQANDRGALGGHRC